MSSAKSPHLPGAILSLFLVVLVGAGLPAGATRLGRPPEQSFGPVRAASRAHPLAAGSLPRPSPLRTSAASAAVQWQPYPIDGGETLSIAMSPADAQTLYVGTRVAGVFKTTDGGATRQPARQGLTFFPIRNLEDDLPYMVHLPLVTRFTGGR